MQYTPEQRAAVVELRDAGLSWFDVSEELYKRYHFDLSEEASRSLYRRVKQAKPKVKPAKRQILLSEFKDISRTVEARNDRILFISDMHIPYQHPDTVDFLTAVKKKYRPTRVVCVGDEVDKHAMSFHDSDPDLASAGDELNKAIEQLQPLYKLFPSMDLVDSNHGSMVYRKGKHHGIPRKYIRDYGEVLEAPSGWQWSHDLTLILPNGNKCYVHHGLSKDIMKVVNQRGTCAVSGHFHTEFRIGYSGNPDALLWGMNVGCSIDSDALAFAYDRNNLGRPIIGHGIVLDSQPKLLPMVLNKHNRWEGVVP